MTEIIKEEKFLQISATVFWKTANLLRKRLNTYDLPPINGNEGNINLLKQLLSNQRLKVDWVSNCQATFRLKIHATISNSRLKLKNGVACKQKRVNERVDLIFLATKKRRP